MPRERYTLNVTHGGSHSLEGPAADTMADWHRFNTPSKPRRLHLEFQLPFTWWGGGGTVGGRGEREEQFWLSGGTVIIPLWQGISTEPLSVKPAHLCAGRTAPALRQQTLLILSVNTQIIIWALAYHLLCQRFPLEKRNGSSYSNGSLQLAGSFSL